MSKHTSNGNRVIEITQTRVVEQLELDPHGSHDVLSILAEVAMRDARDSMRSDAESISVYEVDDESVGKVAVRIEHSPFSGEPRLTVEQAKAALADARRRERKEPVAEQAGPDDWS